MSFGILKIFVLAALLISSVKAIQLEKNQYATLQSKFSMKFSELAVQSDPGTQTIAGCVDEECLEPAASSSSVPFGDRVRFSMPACSDLSDCGGRNYCSSVGNGVQCQHYFCATDSSNGLPLCGDETSPSTCKHGEKDGILISHKGMQVFVKTCVLKTQNNGKLYVETESAVVTLGVVVTAEPIEAMSATLNGQTLANESEGIWSEDVQLSSRGASKLCFKEYSNDDGEFPLCNGSDGASCQECSRDSADCGAKTKLPKDPSRMHGKAVFLKATACDSNGMKASASSYQFKMKPKAPVISFLNDDCTQGAYFHSFGSTMMCYVVTAGVTGDLLTGACSLTGEDCLNGSQVYQKDFVFQESVQIVGCRDGVPSDIVNYGGACAPQL